MDISILRTDTGADGMNFGGIGWTWEGWDESRRDGMWEFLLQRRWEEAFVISNQSYKFSEWAISSSRRNISHAYGIKANKNQKESSIMRNMRIDEENKQNWTNWRIIWGCSTLIIDEVELKDHTQPKIKISIITFGRTTQTDQPGWSMTTKNRFREVQNSRSQQKLYKILRIY